MEPAAFTSVPASSSASRPESPIRLARELAQRLRQERLVAPRDQLLYAFEHRIHPFRIERRPLGPQDTVRLGGDRPLRRVEQLLAQLLAGAAADDLDRHVVRVLARTA